MTVGQKTLLTWLALGGGALALYLIAKKQISTAASAISTNVGGTVAAPFESAYTALTGMATTPSTPANQSPSTPLCYYRDPAGNLMYDANGNILSGPCAPGDIGTTPYPG